jgi:hypothetical protein
VTQRYEALAESLREQAGRHVRLARSSDSLRDIVRLIAAASTLERAARKLRSTTDVDLSDIAQKLNAGASLIADCSLQPTSRASTTEALDRTSSSGGASQATVDVLISTHDSGAQCGSSSMPMWKLIAMLSRPGGQS